MFQIVQNLVIFDPAHNVWPENRSDEPYWLSSHHKAASPQNDAGFKLLMQDITLKVIDSEFDRVISDVSQYLSLGSDFHHQELEFRPKPEPVSHLV